MLKILKFVLYCLIVLFVNSSFLYSSSLNLNTLLSLSLTQQATGPTPFIDLQYGYDGVGNVMSITDILNSANNKSMQYDNLNRLTNSDGPWGQDGAFELGTFTYDALGNRNTSIIGSNSATFTYDPSTNRLNNLTYDNNGNVTGDGNFTYTYDSDNRLTQVTNGIDTITYEYDGEGRRITQTENGVTTIYVYGTGLNVHTEFDGFGVPKVLGSGFCCFVIDGLVVKCLILLLE